MFVSKPLWGKNADFISGALSGNRSLHIEVMFDLNDWNFSRTDLDLQSPHRKCFPKAPRSDFCSCAAPKLFGVGVELQWRQGF